MKRLFIGLMLAATLSAESLETAHEKWTNQMRELKQQVAERPDTSGVLIDRTNNPERISLSEGVKQILAGAEDLKVAEKKKDYVEACYIAQDLMTLVYNMLLQLPPKGKQSQQVEKQIKPMEKNLELVCKAGIKQERI